MSSTIFYRFKSQKDTSRILFDGTGLTVFDLKREIILNNKLGDGTDFQLRLYSIDTGEEYEEDQVVIPRSSTVIVRRSPAYRPVGMGSLLNGNARTTIINNSSSNTIVNATRYVTGKPRVTKKKPTMITTTTTTAAAAAVTTAISNGSNPLISNNFTLSSSPLIMGNHINNRVDTGITEEERIARMFATQANEWEKTQEEMSSITPVIVRNNNNSGHRGHDEGPPPAGYMCYRCGSRNHWIKNCPTNNDPNFEGKRIKRTTGIPKKFLQNVEIDVQNMTPEEMLQRKIMITDDGKFVVQVEDKQSWDEYQRRQEQKQLKFIGNNDKDIRWRPNYYPSLPNDLKCPITGGILKDAVKTSNCCNKIFSKNALEDLLLDNDFVCPSCGHEEILLDSLIPEETIRERVKQYMEEHDNDKNMNNTNNKSIEVENQGENKGAIDVVKKDIKQNNNNNNEDKDQDDNEDDSTLKSKKIKLSTNESNNSDNSNSNSNSISALPPPPPSAPLPFVPMPFVPMFAPFIPTPPLPTTNASSNTSTNANTNTNIASNNINTTKS